MQKEIYSAVACNLDRNILEAIWPLLKRGEIEGIEWSFDTLYSVSTVPNWFCDLLRAFSDQGRLIGHGVYFSIFSGRFLPGQKEWLAQLSALSETYSFDHITEHFGFMTGRDFHHGAPMSVPLTSTTLRIGIDRMKRIQDACQCPVGIENLAFAASIDQIRYQGEFLQNLVEPVNGFIILDLHNIYCQLCNFDWSWSDVISAFPLDRVREIHISGGSWQESEIAGGEPIRRDTHDEAVPEVVFQLLSDVLPLCPNVKFVVLEQIGFSLASETRKDSFRSDYRRMKSIVEQHKTSLRESDLISINTFMPHHCAPLSDPVEDEQLYTEQLVLTDILEKAPDKTTAIHQLNHSILSNSAWNVENWKSEMIETARLITQKWKEGFHAYNPSD